ncbi:MAG: DUF1298 domain-containing protein [Actinobacteria bacterium]|nr:DUF1298 domain-containing protein [Actinomycetota bacterium]
MDELRFDERMSDSDSLMWTIEKDPMLRSTITAVLLLDRAPDREHFRSLLDRGTRLVPRMRQRVRSNSLSMAPPRWENDPYFDLDYHLRWSRAAGARDLRAVLDLAQPMAMQGFDRARPLWEAVVVEDLADGGAAVIMKVHHAITDGVGAVKIALVMFELERDASIGELPDEPEARVMNQLQRFIDAADHARRRNLGIVKRLPGAALGAAATATRDPIGAVRRTAEAAASIARMAAPANEPLSPLMRGRSLSVHFDTLSVPLDDVRRAAKAADVRINDVFLAAAAAGLRRYHDRHGVEATALRVSMPINLRSDEEADATGNNFAPARFAIPLDIDDPLEAVHTFRDLVAVQRAEPALAAVEPMARVLNQLPTAMSTGLFGSMLKGVDVVASNVPGAPIALYTAGAEVTAMYALGPMVGAGVDLTLLSYRDDVFVGVNVDPAAVPDPEVMRECLVEGWDHVLALGRPV